MHRPAQAETECSTEQHPHQFVTLPAVASVLPAVPSRTLLLFVLLPLTQECLRAAHRAWVASRRLRPVPTTAFSCSAFIERLVEARGLQAILVTG